MPQEVYVCFQVRARVTGRGTLFIVGKKRQTKRTIGDALSLLQETVAGSIERIARETNGFVYNDFAFSHHSEAIRVNIRVAFKAGRDWLIAQQFVAVESDAKEQEERAKQ
jgi:hypothetical protein